MTESTPAPDRWALPSGPDKTAALIDILLFIGTLFAFWFGEEALRGIGRFPYPGLFDGGPTLIASFFVIAAIMRWRGQSWPEFGLRRPPNWWFIPAWGLLVIVVNIVMQVAIVQSIGAMLELPAPDLTRYDVIVGNFRMFLIATIGAMVTGGFIEEFIYRGFMVDRIARLSGGGRRGLIVGALLCGLPFGLIHFEWGIGGMFVTTIMGSILGLMYLATRRNLWPLVAGHAMLDLILMLQVYLGALE